MYFDLLLIPMKMCFFILKERENEIKKKKLNTKIKTKTRTKPKPNQKILKYDIMFIHRKANIF